MSAQLKNTPSSFGAATKAFHWIMALLIVCMLAAGLYMGGMEAGLNKLKVYNLHKSMGVLVLVLVILRMIWHVYSKRPDFVASLKAWEKNLARVLHFFLYIAMIGMPLSGWMMSSAAGRPVQFFGLFALPDLIGPDENLRNVFGDVHEYLAWALIGALALHISGALKHHIIDGDRTLRRMLPFALAFLLLSFPAAAAKWEMLATESSISFKGKQMQEGFSGSFANFTPEIDFDPAHLDQAKVIVSIDTGSIDTNDDERDATARSKGWFDVTQFPAARFESTAFAQTQNGYEVNGNLTIKGVSVPLKMPFTLAFSKDDSGKEKALMKGSVTLDRSKFQLGTGEWADTSVIANEVAVDITVAATPLEEAAATP